MNLLRTLFGIYCLLFFAASFLIVIPLYFLVFNIFPKSSAPVVAHRVSRAWARLIFIGFFVRVKVRNKNLIDPKKQYIFVGNHLSMLDIPTYALACSNTFRFLSKAELAKVPLLGYVIKNLYITVNRADKADRHQPCGAAARRAKLIRRLSCCPCAPRPMRRAMVVVFVIRRRERLGRQRIRLGRGCPSEHRHGRREPPRLPHCGPHTAIRCPTVRLEATPGKRPASR